ncbi:MAG: YhjD/YihY/BrkB family envelope integrity protein, partial [Acidobacteriota bacterium]
MTSFVMLLAWGPILIGATYSALFLLRQQPAFKPIADAVPLHLITFAMTGLGLTMLNWQVPHTFVQFRCAALGGVTSAVLLEGLRASFGLYAQQVPHMSLVYGSFGFALLFMISIQLAWAIVLIGTEVAYCAQHFAAMSRPRREVSSAEGSWLALAVMTLIIDRFRRHEPMTPHDLLAARFGLPTEQVRRTLDPLVRASMLTENQSPIDGYLLSCDPYKTPVADIFDLYETEQWSVLDDLPPAGRGPLESLRARLAEARGKATKKLVLTDLLADEKPEPVDEVTPDP